MGRLAWVAFLLLTSCADAEEVVADAGWQSGEPTASALAADDECRSGGGGAILAAVPADHGKCGLEALQRRSHAAHAVPAVLHDPLAVAADGHERELTSAEVEAEYERLLQDGKLDPLLGSNLQPLLGASTRARRSGNGFGQVLLNMLTLKLGVINRKLHKAIPDTIAEVYDSSTTSKRCCAGTWSTCWCHCELVETMEVQNLTRASSVSIMNISDVTASLALAGPMGLSVNMSLMASNLSVAGEAKRTVKACSHHLGALTGGIWLEASMNGTAILGGAMVMKNGRMCFKCKSVDLHILPDDVRFQREKVNIGSWNVLKLHGSFWNDIVHHLPTKKLINSMTKAADTAIPKALQHQDLCF